MARKTFKIRSEITNALDETISSAVNNAGDLHIEAIPLQKLGLDPDNPRDLLLSPSDLYQGIKGDEEEIKRKKIEKESLSSMVKSIKEQGIINPIVVYKHAEKYRLVAGERRTLSSILAGRKDIPAKILPEKPLPLKLSLLQWAENIEREDLTLWERFRNLEKILGAFADVQNKLISDITATDIHKLLGCSLQQGVNYLNLLSSSPILRNAIKSGKVKNIEKAAFIAKAPAELQEELLVTCINGNTLSEMKKMVKGQGNEIRKHKNEGHQNISFGGTTSTWAAKKIITCLMQDNNLKKYFKDINIDWETPKSVSLGLKKFIKSLELSEGN